MPTPYQERRMRDSSLNPGDQVYFDAAARGELMIGRCGACARPHHYPRTMCPFCLSDDVAMVPARGTGTIYTFSVTRRGTPTPYCIAYVTLDEGVKLMTNIVDCDLDTIRIGQRVQLVFRTTPAGLSMAMFRPV